MDEKPDLRINVNLADVYGFVNSDIFERFLTENCILSTRLYIKTVLNQTIEHMMVDEQEKK